MSAASPRRAAWAVALLAALALSGWSAAAWPQTSATAAPVQSAQNAQARSQAGSAPSRPLGMVGAVLSIVGYTRWPGGRQPVELCIAGVAPLSQELFAAASQWVAPRRIVPRLLAPHDAVPASCHVVFFDGWRDAEQRDAVTALAVRPVLTVGIGPSFCSIGGMFCLQPGPAGVRFAVNTDAVHRSGLTIHPNVLALGRPRPPESR